MADIERTAQAVWNGDLRGGNGTIKTNSDALQDVSYTFATRFEQASGTNPDELLAASHASCYSMAFAATLGRKGYQPQSIQTRATCELTRQEQGGFKITKMRLETRGQVEGIDEATFKQIADEAEKNCPVSNVVRGGLEIELDAALM